MGTVARAARSEAEQYKAGRDIPLGAYAGLMGAYTVTVGAMAVTLHRRGAPERLAWGDLILLALAAQKLSRLISKDAVTSPLRAPFTINVGTDGPAEMAEEVRGNGARKAAGEMVSCPFCIGQWVSTIGVFGMAVAPRWTRLAASVFAISGGADILQFLYARLQQ